MVRRLSIRGAREVRVRGLDEKTSLLDFGVVRRGVWIAICLENSI